MANKRQLKKAIQNACGDIAGECILAESAFGRDNLDKWDNVIMNVALLQQEAVNRVTKHFDQIPSHYPNRKEYNAARRAFYKKAEKELSDYFHAEVEKIAAEMNSLMPKQADVK